MTGSSVQPARPQVAERLLGPSRPGVDAVETHVSTIVFDGELVHKRKKHVRFPFVDVTTLESRRRICCNEVALNRRFRMTFGPGGAAAACACSHRWTPRPP
jgi:aminoglycoside phosphotransferase family enzyme